MTILNPLSDDHIYDINLIPKISDELFAKTYKFLSEVSFSPSKMTKFIKECNDPLIFKVLIHEMNYVNWIKWYSNTQILRYYWSTDMINKIIDVNREKILLAISNNENYDGHVIDIYNSFDINYNFTEKNYNKKLQTLSNLLTSIDDSLNINNFYGDENVMMFIGSKNYVPTILTFYSKTKSVNFKLQPLTEFYFDNFFLYIKKNNLIIRFCMCHIDNNISHIFAVTSGHVNFEEKKIIVNAEAYQLFNKNEYIEKNTSNDIKFGQKSDKTYFKIGVKSIPIKHTFEKCYDCKMLYPTNTEHLFGYDSYCTKCSVRNYANRLLKANLSGFTVLITGIRVKIGFATALKILRNGGNVIGTTRYPNFALKNYSAESDFDTWKHRLIIIKCDFQNIGSAYKLIEIISKYSINAFINNAFKTIKTSTYYDKTVNKIESDLSEKIAICGSNEIVQYDKNIKNENYLDLTSVQIDESKINVTSFRDVRDIPHECSWDKKIDEIDPAEIIECVAVNQLIPTLIINALKPKLQSPKFIINVTSLEGQFNNACKTDKHIHTNMSKAALDMLIRSLSTDDDDNLRVHSINPGFVTGILPQKNEYDYPVSLEDAASKLVFPIMKYFNGEPLGKEYTKIQSYEPMRW